MVDKLIIGVLNNNTKNPLFSADDRVNMLKEVTSHLDNVEVEAFSGLLIDFVKRKNADVVIRGLRAITDFEYELQMAQTNRTMEPTFDTIFLITSLQYAYLSSSTVKEVAKFGGDLNKFLPQQVIPKVKDKYNIK